MRAVVMGRYGAAEVLQVREVSTPQPGPGQVLIRVAYAGVNPVDCKMRSGDIARANRLDIALPFVIGMDAAGVVVSAAPDVTQFKPGDRVITPSEGDGKTWGTYAEYVRVSAKFVAPMPRSLSFAEAACVPVASLTAFQSLFHSDKGALIPGRKVFINGAGGGVGSFAVQFAKAGGLIVSASCSTANIAFAKSLGADCVVNYREQNVVDAVREWSTDGVDVVIEAVGATTIPNALDVLRPGGKLISIYTVNADGDVGRAQQEAERRGFCKVLSIIDFARTQDSLREIGQLIDVGRVRVPPIEVFALEEAAIAHRKVETGHVRGKLALKIADL